MTLHHAEQCKPSPLTYPSRADAYTYSTSTAKVAGLLEEHPELHCWGHGRTRGSRIDVDAARAQLLHPANITRIGLTRCWIAYNLTPAKRDSRHNQSSYVWKHVMQRETELYVPNGVFITAALMSTISVDLDRFNAMLYAKRAPRPAHTTEDTP